MHYFTYLKNYKDSSGKYYQNSKKNNNNNNNNLVKNIEVLLKKEQNQEHSCEQSKLYQKLKNKNWLSVEKNITKWEKGPHYNYMKQFYSEI